MSDDADLLHPVVLHHIVNTLAWPRLRPLQEESVAPLIGGDDALLLAPTAGGKTEAALFPLLSRMAAENWSGTSLVYLCPLKALLNNLEPRLATYTGWLGRQSAVWHGDVTDRRRKAILRARPDVLLTTPESLEAMLVSVNVDHRSFFSDLRAVVVDEIHSFAGDDRGWHLLAVVERLQRLVGRDVQRVGLSATVGNPQDLLRWLQGSAAGRRPARVVAPQVRGMPALVPGLGPGSGSGSVDPPTADIELDYVGSVANAATVLAALHRGEKRLVFCDSKKLVEELGQALRQRGVTTFLSHASLSADERRRSEEAFAQARDCVIVATSTLELGIDVGDLDRVIQLDAPGTVASFLQRLGRTGRRPGAVRNCLFLVLSDGALLRAAGLLLLWGQHWVEPVVPPPQPRHIVAQQILALCLQENRVGDRSWSQEWNGLAPFDRGGEPILGHLVRQGYLDTDSGMIFIGPEAERRFGHRHFSALTAVFTAAPEFSVLSGRDEIGRTDPVLLTEQVAGPRLLLLGGRSWRVTHIDWTHRRCYVEPADGGGKARWITFGMGGLSFWLTRAMREIMLGARPPVAMTTRASRRLDAIGARHPDTVHARGTVIVRDDNGDVRWWTWAGYRANLTLTATLADMADPLQRADEAFIRLRADLTAQMWQAATADAGERLCLPHVGEQALAGLKFSVALPARLAEATLAARLADLEGAGAVLAEPVRFSHHSGPAVGPAAGPAG
ncbi:DEAD/DEAH box helicase [Frankia sp. Cr2]|uniref:DEAD/DEAH box helicase n=1 Tax=Frankia sp. Cr2 TaxID=3073932 RepID=UPI002AD545A1|nr:DEAD/DEAH box helicase [Frankia sp. Cr2]